MTFLQGIITNWSFFYISSNFQKTLRMLCYNITRGSTHHRLGFHYMAEVIAMKGLFIRGIWRTWLKIVSTKPMMRGV